MASEWYIYAHILKSDGRRYIGQTNNIRERWKPSSYKTCTKFYRAINKYGWENFEHVIIESGLTLEQANERETYWIAYYDTMNKGFNLNSGGQNRLASEETKAKMSKTRKNVPHSQEHNEAISKALKGKKKTAEHIRNNQLAQHRKEVKCLETGECYESLADAQRKTGVFAESISRACRGINKTAGGFHWNFIEKELK